MAVVAHVVLQGITPDQYDALRAEARWLEEVPEGGYCHLAWWEGDVNHNVDAWESEAAFAAFVEGRLGSAMAKLGIEAVPDVTFHPAHEVFTPQVLRLT